MNAAEKLLNGAGFPLGEVMSGNSMKGKHTPKVALLGSGVSELERLQCTRQLLMSLTLMYSLAPNYLRHFFFYFNSYSNII